MSEPVDINKLRERLSHLITYSHMPPSSSKVTTTTTSENATVSINREVLSDVLAGILDLIEELNAPRQRGLGYPGRLQLKSFRRGEQSTSDGGKTWVHDKSGEAAGFGSPELDPVRERGMKEPAREEENPYTHAAAVVHAVLAEASLYVPRCGVSAFTDEQLENIVDAAHGALKVVDRERENTP